MPTRNGRSLISSSAAATLLLILLDLAKICIPGNNLFQKIEEVSDKMGGKFLATAVNNSRPQTAPNRNKPLDKLTRESSFGHR